MDARDAALLMAIPLQTNEEVIAWFEILHTSYGSLSDPSATEEFAEAVRQAATWCDAEPFLQALTDTDEGLTPIARLVTDPPHLPDDYWVIYHQWYGTEGDSEDPFGWLTAEQAGRLEHAWGSGWREHLGPQLEYRWGADWQAHPAEHRQHWLSDVLDELLTPAQDHPTDESSHAHDTPGQEPEHTEQSLDALAEQLVADTLAELEDDIEPLSPEEVAEAVAIVRRQLQEEMAHD